MPQFYGVQRLMELVNLFESSAHLDIDVIVKTDGKVKLLIRDPEADRQRTESFVSLNQAKEWVEGVVYGDK